MLLVTWDTWSLVSLAMYIVPCGLKTAESSGLRLALGISGQKTLNLLPNSWSAYQGISSAHGDAFSCLSYHVCPCVPQ